MMAGQLRYHVMAAQKAMLRVGLVGSQEGVLLANQV